jgi:hypothetical protein
MRSESVQSSEETEFYLVKLLERFARAEREWFTRPLALEFRVLHSLIGHRAAARHVADTSVSVGNMESIHARW